MVGILGYITDEFCLKSMMKWDLKELLCIDHIKLRTSFKIKPQPKLISHPNPDSSGCPDVRCTTSKDARLATSQTTPWPPESRSDGAPGGEAVKQHNSENRWIMQYKTANMHFIYNNIESSM